MFEISKEQLQAIANYLATKPFQEVAQLIQMLTQLKPVDAKPEVKAE